MYTWKHKSIISLKTGKYINKYNHVYNDDEKVKLNTTIYLIGIFINYKFSKSHFCPCFVICFRILQVRFWLFLCLYIFIRCFLIVQNTIHNYVYSIASTFLRTVLMCNNCYLTAMSRQYTRFIVCEKYNVSVVLSTHCSTYVK